MIEKTSNWLAHKVGQPQPGRKDRQSVTWQLMILRCSWWIQSTSWLPQLLLLLRQPWQPPSRHLSILLTYLYAVQTKPLLHKLCCKNTLQQNAFLHAMFSYHALLLSIFRHESICQQPHKHNSSFQHCTQIVKKQLLFWCRSAIPKKIQLWKGLRIELKLGSVLELVKH